MARIRTIKPEFYTHADLFDLEQASRLPIRLSFSGLFTCCDREGRFKWIPRELKLHVLPYDQIDFSRVLDALWTRGYLVKYACGTATYGCIPSWKNHQVINNRERPSELPSPSDSCIIDPPKFNDLFSEIDACPTRAPRDEHAPSGEGKGRERKGKIEAKASLSGLLKNNLSLDSESQKEKIPYAEIIDYLNKIGNTKYRSSSKGTQNLIRILWKEGFTLDDFKKTIDNMAEKWLRDNKMVQFFRPSTLFSSKFESYLNLPIAKNLWED